SLSCLKKTLLKKENQLGVQASFDQFVNTGVISKYELSKIFQVLNFCDTCKIKDCLEFVVQNTDIEEVTTKNGKFKIETTGSIQLNTVKSISSIFDEMDYTNLYRDDDVLDSLMVIARPRRFVPANNVWLNYIEPIFLLSKIEENNRILSSSPPTNSTDSLGRRGLDPLDMFRHQQVSFGAYLNFWRLNLPQAKLSAEINVGAFWYQTQVSNQDVVPVENPASQNVSAIYFPFGGRVIFKPDGRWGAEISGYYIKQHSRSEEFRLLNKRGLGQFGFDGYLKTNETSRLFFRYRYTYEYENHDNSFPQIQLGYSMSILGNSN
ncbi:MAG: hypothetical protein AAGC47_13710, partial [Bacteroidota bacterium]